MIREALIGTALIGGGGYYVMTYSVSAAVVRTVNASPQDTWRPFDLILNQYSQHVAAMGGDAGGFANEKTPLPLPIVVSVPGKEIDLRVNRDGVEAVHVHLTFESLDGNRTRMTMQVDATPNAVSAADARRLGGNAAFKQALEKMADELIPQIESGKLVQTAEAFAEMRRRMVADPHAGQMRMYQEEYKRREAQAAATRPMLDPNKAALDPKGASAAPMSGREY